MRVLILGAGGFIGTRVAAEAVRAGWDVRAGARNVAGARRRAPDLDWVCADFAALKTPDAWSALLADVDAVINCVGVLQDAAGDSSRIAHVDGPAALVRACEASGVRRLIHVSAVGADDRAGTAYAADKGAAERLVAASGLDWLVVRPSLVVAREVFGGTALIRGLAGLPGLVPVVGGAQAFRPVGAGDLSRLLVGWLAPGGRARRRGGGTPDRLPGGAGGRLSPVAGIPRCSRPGGPGLGRAAGPDAGRPRGLAGLALGLAHHQPEAA